MGGYSQALHASETGLSSSHVKRVPVAYNTNNCFYDHFRGSSNMFLQTCFGTLSVFLTVVTAAVPSPTAPTPSTAGACDVIQS